MDKRHVIHAGKEVHITNPEHPKAGEIGCYAGLADTYGSSEQKHRISFDGDIYLVSNGDFAIA